MSLMAMLLAGTLHRAWAQEPPGDPTVLTRSVIQAVDPCPVRYEYASLRVERAEAKSRNAAEAIEAARQLAFQRLEEKVCAGIEDTPRCLAGRRAIVAYGAGAFDKKSRSACASVAVEVTVLDSMEADLGRLDDAWSGLAWTVRQQAADAPLRIEPPVWAASGCTAGEVGAHLGNMLEARLAGAKFADSAAPGVARLRLKLTAAGERVQVAAALKNGSDWVGLQVPDLSFPRDLFRLREEEAGSCPADESLGLTDASRPGDGGLSIDLSAGGEGGLFCEGETVSPHLNLSGPARVRLYTVQADGQGFQVWPWSAADDRVFDPAYPPDLPFFTASRTWDGSDSRLIAVAFPDDAPLADFCRLATPFDATALPATTAVDSVSFHVAAAGERLCKARGSRDKAVSDRQSAEAALSQAHECAPPTSN